MYYILQVRHKSFGDKLKSDYSTIKGYLNDCNIVRYLYSSDDLYSVVDKYLEFVECDSNCKRHDGESIINCLNDDYHCGIIHRLTVYGIPREYVLIDDRRNSDLMNNNFYSLVRDSKLKTILDT